MTVDYDDYVSFGLAKLLNEKGYNIPTMYHYFFNNDTNRLYFSSSTIFMLNENGYYMPTYQSAMKWVRETHGFLISPYKTSIGWYFEIFSVKNTDITGSKPIYAVGIPKQEDICETYEDAVEAGLKYTLEKYIVV